MAACEDQRFALVGVDNGPGSKGLARRLVDSNANGRSPRYFGRIGERLRRFRLDRRRDRSRALGDRLLGDRLQRKRCGRGIARSHRSSAAMGRDMARGRNPARCGHHATLQLIEGNRPENPVDLATFAYQQRGRSRMDAPSLRCERIGGKIYPSDRPTVAQGLLDRLVHRPALGTSRGDELQRHAIAHGLGRHGLGKDEWRKKAANELAQTERVQPQHAGFSIILLSELLFQSLEGRVGVSRLPRLGTRSNWIRFVC